MFKFAISYLESVTPTWVKVSIAVVVVGWMAPLEFTKFCKNFIQGEVHAVIAPMRMARDSEIKAINNELQDLNEKSNETNSFVKAIALEQLGAKRYQQVEILSADKK